MHDVVWFTDLPLGQGGAAMTDEQIVAEGMRRGLNIRVVLPGMEPPKAGFAVVSNATGFQKSLLAKYCGETPYAVFLHDYWLLCWGRLFYPASEKCGKCVNRDFAGEFLSRSKRIFWMSPLHREAWLRAVPELEDHPYALIPSAFSKPQVEAFKNAGSNPTPHTVLGVNSLLPYKGRDLVLEYAGNHSEFNFTFVGAGEGEFRLPVNCRWIGFKPQEELLKLYGSHEYFIHLPSGVEPCGRTVVEALLSGRKLIVNANIGFLSYFSGRPSLEEVEKTVLSSPGRFWEAVGFG